ncbi:DM13 domain-containing protein [uncultured Polaribacter sp.]|uniref:T9SS type A sorting domain-containing protein n=1 Tax=uncultured Polaribacter sp. TaxID=174711 RepID=UPI00259AF094|nr:DM13 domain-containing protein [uncultured Polaribacter sp.]
MKTLLLTAFLSFTFLQINAQCSENASNFGNNTSTPSYNVSGDISVTLNTNNTIIINFASNYSTASGPDVRLYLIKSEGKSIAELKSLNPENLENISFGLVGFSGAQNYTQSIPNGVDISEYDTVFFFCLQFTAFWDVGTFTPFSSTNCSVLSTVALPVDKIEFYPNPAKDKIQISNIDGVSAEIRIFNALGKQVLHQPKITKKTIDISSFHKGIYIVKISVDGKSKTKKLVIQ